MANMNPAALPKFGRNYSLAIQTDLGLILEVNPNLTVEFDITRNTFGTPNAAKFRIYNLSETHRNSIRLNVTQRISDFRSFLFRAGYGTNLPVLFAGNVTECYSAREGNNFITTIECLDGGFAFITGFIETTVPGSTNLPTPYTSVMRDAINNWLPNVSVGAIGSFEGGLTKDNAYSQRTVDFLTELTGGGFFVDNQKAYCLKDNEVIPGQVATISPTSGLLGTPILQGTILTFDMILEPALIVGQQVTLQSITATNFNSNFRPSPNANVNGPYKIVSLKHKGIISPVVCGEAITSVGMQSFSELFSVVPG